MSVRDLSSAHQPAVKTNHASGLVLEVMNPSVEVSKSDQRMKSTCETITNTRMQRTKSIPSDSASVCMSVCISDDTLSSVEAFVAISEP